MTCSAQLSNVTDKRPIQLIEAGEGKIVVPYSLAFNPELDPFEVRCWMFMLIHYERKKMIHMEQIAERFSVSDAEVLASVAMLDIYGWLVVRNAHNDPEHPVMSVSRLSLSEQLRHNPGFELNLKHYAENGVERVRIAALRKLAQISEPELIQ